MDIEGDGCALDGNDLANQLGKISDRPAELAGIHIKDCLLL